MGFKKKLEVAVGLEPTKVGFADRRLDRFGIATLYPNLYPKLYPNRPRIAYLPHTISLQVVDSECDRANEMVLQTIALPLGDRATGLKSCQFSVVSSQSEKNAPKLLFCTCKLLVVNSPFSFRMVVSSLLRSDRIMRDCFFAVTVNSVFLKRKVPLIKILSRAVPLQERAALASGLKPPAQVGRHGFR